MNEPCRLCKGTGRDPADRLAGVALEDSVLCPRCSGDGELEDVAPAVREDAPRSGSLERPYQQRVSENTVLRTHTFAPEVAHPFHVPKLVDARGAGLWVRGPLEGERCERCAEDAAALDRALDRLAQKIRPRDARR